MNRKLTATRESKIKARQHELRFFTETVDAGRIRHLHFLRQGIRVIKMNDFIGKMQIKH